MVSINLIGAMIGGFSEYLGMAIGSQNLALLVVGTYGASPLHATEPLLVPTSEAPLSPNP
jgi:hypothetical protein